MPEIKAENTLRVLAIDELLNLDDSDDAAEEAFTDLLCDLMHACDARGFSFASLVDRAEQHYVEEK